MRTRTSVKHLTETKEPLGIVIADGGAGNAAPRFSAFVWGPVPEELEVLEELEPSAHALAIAAA